MSERKALLQARRPRLLDLFCGAGGASVFESNVLIFGSVCRCSEDHRPVIDVSGGGPTHAARKDGGGWRTYKGTADQARAAMGVDWMTKAELNEAISPVYSMLIGSTLRLHVQQSASATAIAGVSGEDRGRIPPLLLRILPKRGRNENHAGSAALHEADVLLLRCPDPLARTDLSRTHRPSYPRSA